jgi:hypothetical protein
LWKTVRILLHFCPSHFLVLKKSIGGPTSEANSVGKRRTTMAKLTNRISQPKSGRKLLAALGLCALAATSATEALAHIEEVGPLRTDVYYHTFYSGGPSSIVVSGDGDTDLDCRVYNANGRLVASDTDYTDDCILVWEPTRTGQHRIEIKNLGVISNVYAMETSE